MAVRDFIDGKLARRMGPVTRFGTQGDYLADLVELTDHPPLDVEGVKRLFFKWEEHKAEGIMTFRNHAHTRCSSREALTLTLTQNPSLNPNPEQPKP